METLPVPPSPHDDLDLEAKVHAMQLRAAVLSMGIHALRSRYVDD
jgi:hypothetical protein